MAVSAYILIQTEVGKAAQVATEVRGIDGVVAADDVTGPYDVIARAEAATMDDLGKMVVSRVQMIEGITRTRLDLGSRVGANRLGQVWPTSMARMPRPIRNSPPPP